MKLRRFLVGANLAGLAAIGVWFASGTVGVDPSSPVTQRSHGAHVYDTAVQAIPHNATTVFDGFDTILGSDPDGYFDAGDPDRLTIPSGLGGRYLVKGHTFNGTLNPDHDVILCFQVNSTGHPDQSVCNTVVRESSRSSQVVGYVDILAIVELDAGDYIRLECYVDNAPTGGGPFDFGHASSIGAMTSLSLVYLGPTSLSGVELDSVDVAEPGSDPAAPAAGMIRYFAKDGVLNQIDDAAVVTQVGTGVSGGVGPVHATGVKLTGPIVTMEQV